MSVIKRPSLQGSGPFTKWSQRRESNPLHHFTKVACCRYHYAGGLTFLIHLFVSLFCGETELFIRHKLEQMMGVEPTHSTWKDDRLPLHHICIKIGAGKGNRTLVSALGRPCSAIEPHPHLSTCQSQRPRHGDFIVKKEHHRLILTRVAVIPSQPIPVRVTTFVLKQVIKALFVSTNPSSFGA